MNREGVPWRLASLSTQTKRYLIDWRRQMRALKDRFYRGWLISPIVGTISIWPNSRSMGGRKRNDVSRIKKSSRNSPKRISHGFKQRAAEMKAEELSLRELRRLRKLTQARLSRKLKIGQEGVSRIEKRSDLYISTLRSYVEGVGREAFARRRTSRSSHRSFSPVWGTKSAQGAPGKRPRHPLDPMRKHAARRDPDDILRSTPRYRT